MKINITHQECLWLIDLVRKEKDKSINLNEQSPHRLFELRRDNMKDLETKLTDAVKRQQNQAR